MSKYLKIAIGSMLFAFGNVFYRDIVGYDFLKPLWVAIGILGLILLCSGMVDD